MTIINLARTLKETYPDYDFVPVYWMASEDHDFEEISYFSLFGKKHTWPGEHTRCRGAPQSPRARKPSWTNYPSVPSLFRKAYLEHTTLADAVRCYMHELFGAQGLITLDADDAALKRHFLPVIEDELFQSNFRQTGGRNYRPPGIPRVPQPRSRAREINLFYLLDTTCANA